LLTFAGISNNLRRMTNKLIGLLLVLPLVGAQPAGYRPAGYKYWSAAELKGMAKPLANKADAKTSSENLGNFGVDHVLMVHREGSGQAELHETEADLIVVESGTGTLIVGGKMPGAKKTAAGEMRAPSIDGGMSQKIGPGDILHIPPKTAHQVTLEPGTQITYFTLKVKE
jgi:mannose-6-phosphate isomerase-like protein (cupin superfamily)